jgi:hypothetical protein
MEEDQVPVTADLLAAGQSDRGGWSKAQLALLGVPWPPPAGWKTTAMGRLIPRAVAARFVALRGTQPRTHAACSGGTRLVTLR